MSNKEFNNFMSLLKDDLSTAECFGFAYLNCTPRQLCKVIDFYFEHDLTSTKEAPNGETLIKFGMFTYPVDEYRVFGKYPNYITRGTFTDLMKGVRRK